MRSIAVFWLALCSPVFAAIGEFPARVVASELKHESYFRSVGVAFQRADGSYVTPVGPTTVDRVLMRKDGSAFAIAFYQNDGGVLTLLAEPIVISNVLRSPFGTIIKVGAEDFNCTRVQLAGEHIDLYVKRGKLVVEHSPEPNQSLEPTTLLVMPRACARVTPSKVVAHL